MRGSTWLALFVVCAVGISGAAIADRADPTREQLARDISEIDSDIKDAARRATQYADGSLIRIQVELELATLRTTRAMLEQKRKSWFRGLTLVFTVEGKAISPANTEVIDGISAEITETLRKASDARAKADLYSGGLVQSLALLEEHTLRSSAAILVQKRALLQLGSVLIPSSPISAPPIGQKADDRGAL